MSPGLNFQYLSSLSSRASSRARCSCGRHVQHALDDHEAVGDEPGLELVDLVVAALDRRRLGELVDPHDQDVLVVGAVEDADVARLRQGVADPPQEAVLALLVGGRLEAGDLHALRVDQADRVAQHSALAGGVHALQHQQHAPLGAGGALGPEHLLQVGQLVAEGEQGGLALGLAPVEPRRLRRSGWQRGRRRRVGAGGDGRRSWAHHVGSSSTAPSSSRTTANASPAG